MNTVLLIVHKNIFLTLFITVHKEAMEEGVTIIQETPCKRLEKYMHINICWWLYYFMERNNSNWENVNLLGERHFLLCTTQWHWC